MIYTAVVTRPFQPTMFPSIMRQTPTTEEPESVSDEEEFSEHSSDCQDQIEIEEVEKTVGDLIEEIKKQKDDFSSIKMTFDKIDELLEQEEARLLKIEKTISTAKTKIKKSTISEYSKARADYASLRADFATLASTDMPKAKQLFDKVVLCAAKTAELQAKAAVLVGRRLKRVKDIEKASQAVTKALEDVKKLVEEGKGKRALLRLASIVDKEIKELGKLTCKPVVCRLCWSILFKSLRGGNHNKKGRAIKSVVYWNCAWIMRIKKTKSGRDSLPYYWHLARKTYVEKYMAFVPPQKVPEARKKLDDLLYRFKYPLLKVVLPGKAGQCKHNCTKNATEFEDVLFDDYKREWNAQIDATDEYKYSDLEGDISDHINYSEESSEEDHSNTNSGQRQRNLEDHEETLIQSKSLIEKPKKNTDDGISTDFETPFSTKNAYKPRKEIANYHEEFVHQLNSKIENLDYSNENRSKKILPFTNDSKSKPQTKNPPLPTPRNSEKEDASKLGKRGNPRQQSQLEDLQNSGSQHSSSDSESQRENSVSRPSERNIEDQARVQPYVSAFSRRKAAEKQRRNTRAAEGRKTNATKMLKKKYGHTGYIKKKGQDKTYFDLEEDEIYIYWDMAQERLDVNQQQVEDQPPN
jgi:hypothetical protein